MSTLVGTNAAGKIGWVLLEETPRMPTRRKGPKTAKLLSAHFFHIFPVPRNYMYETNKKIQFQQYLATEGFFS